MESRFKAEFDKQKKVTEVLIRLIGYRADSSNDFLYFVLKEVVKQTGSRLGYIFRVIENTQSFEFIDLYNPLDSKRIVREQFKGYKLSKAGPWTKALEFNKPFVLNTESKLFHETENKGLFETAHRLCSLPVIISEFQTVLVITDKDKDFDQDDIEYLELLSGPVCNLVRIFRRLEELTLAKDNAEKSEKRKLTYLTNISHEIKTPVNAIAGFSQLLKEEDQSPGNREKFLDVILESSTDLVAIINNVTEISNIESESIRINEKEVLLSDIFNELSEQFKEEASRKKLLFSTQNTISEKEGKILADKGRLLQVFSALLSNSFKFTFTGKIVFGCKLRNDFIEFFVSDTGIGIPKEEKDKVFDHFFQADNSISNSFKGTGLGLTIAKAVTKLTGGEIWCNSAEGKGSDFHFTVPYKRSHINSISGSASVIEDNIQKQRKKVILVAEDDNLNFDLIRNFLSAFDIVLLRAVNGKEAVNLCSLRKVDLVLMDVKMPVMDGLTAARIIKDADPDLIIIAQTAYINDREIALKSGCDDFITKPFRKNQFISLINSYI
jgi:signal transduction histidine kinase/CheY-like chemotaxis protein